MNRDALHHYLEPLSPWLHDALVSDVFINKAGLLWVVRDNQKKEVRVPALSYHALTGLARLIANDTKQRLSEAEPLLSAVLPEGERIQIVLSPVCVNEGQASIAMAIRKKVARDLSLNELLARGLCDAVNPFFLPHTKSFLSSDEKVLRDHFSAGRYLDFLTEAIAQKKNILISGATGSGKTTLLNACLKEIPLDERIITLEDVPELVMPHPDKTNLVASKNQQGVANVDMEKLVQVCLRLNPDRIILGEIRGDEAWDFMQAASTGHEGTLASIHAGNPHLAFIRLANMVQGNPKVSLSREHILNDLTSLIDVVVQMKAVRQGDGWYRRITDIYSAFNPGERSC